MNKPLAKYILLFFVFMILNLMEVDLYSENKYIFREDFNSLKSWKNLYFSKIKKYSKYSIEKKGSNNFLKCESSSSASAIILNKKINIYEYPVMEWRWKVSNVYSKGDARKKKGDDFPIRVYVLFEYNPDNSGLFEKLKYNSVKFIYGDYPPHSSLNYIWSNKIYSERILTSVYADQVKLYVLEMGSKNVNTWKKEQANILDDYKKAFGNYPPKEATIAIMIDSDNTGESAVSYLDYLYIRSQ